MHYFKMNIGDYAKKAGRLSMIEHGAYTLLIHSCYDREQFPTLEDAIDWCWARTDEEKKAVEFVLSKFFDLVDGVYVQKRIEEELAKYHENSAINKRIALEREEKRTKRTRTVNEPPPNQEPRTIKPLNQEPLKRVSKKDNPDFDEFWNAYPKKSAKQEALKAWAKNKPPLADVLKSLSWQTKSMQWADSQFIPNASTYLNQKRWEDEPPDKPLNIVTMGRDKKASIAATSIFKGDNNGFENARIIEHEPIEKLMG